MHVRCSQLVSEVGGSCSPPESVACARVRQLPRGAKDSSTLEKRDQSDPSPPARKRSRQSPSRVLQNQKSHSIAHEVIKAKEKAPISETLEMKEVKETKASNSSIGDRVKCAKEEKKKLLSDFIDRAVKRAAQNEKKLSSDSPAHRVHETKDKMLSSTSLDHGVERAAQKKKLASDSLGQGVKTRGDRRRQCEVQLSSPTSPPHIKRRRLMSTQRKPSPSLPPRRTLRGSETSKPPPTDERSMRVTSSVSTRAKRERPTGERAKTSAAIRLRGSLRSTQGSVKPSPPQAPTLTDETSPCLYSSHPWVEASLSLACRGESHVFVSLQLLTPREGSVASRGGGSNALSWVKPAMARASSRR